SKPLAPSPKKATSAKPSPSKSKSPNRRLASPRNGGSPATGHEGIDWLKRMRPQRDPTPDPTIADLGKNPTKTPNEEVMPPIAEEPIIVEKPIIVERPATPLGEGICPPPESPLSPVPQEISDVPPVKPPVKVTAKVTEAGTETAKDTEESKKWKSPVSGHPKEPVTKRIKPNAELPIPPRCSTRWEEMAKPKEPRADIDFGSKTVNYTQCKGARGRCNSVNGDSKSPIGTSNTIGVSSSDSGTNAGSISTSDSSNTSLPITLASTSFTVPTSSTSQSSSYGDSSTISSFEATESGLSSDGTSTWVIWVIHAFDANITIIPGKRNMIPTTPPRIMPADTSPMLTNPVSMTTYGISTTMSAPSSTPNNSNSHKTKQMSTIIGAVIGVVIFLLLLALGVVHYNRLRRNRKHMLLPSPTVMLQYPQIQPSSQHFAIHKPRGREVPVPASADDLIPTFISSAIVELDVEEGVPGANLLEKGTKLVATRSLSVDSDDNAPDLSLPRGLAERERLQTLAEESTLHPSTSTLRPRARNDEMAEEITRLRTQIQQLIINGVSGWDPDEQYATSEDRISQDMKKGAWYLYDLSTSSQLERTWREAVLGALTLQSGLHHVHQKPIGFLVHRNHGEAVIGT
ncbi:hypothetical protein ARMGADRAFT_1036066, partial [Armillaria gallica]